MVGDTLILTWEFFTEDKLHDGKTEFVCNNLDHLSTI
jgi:hypothetical protein